MSIVDATVRGSRAARATAPAGAWVGGIEKNHVARMPAPEMTAVDFQSMFEKTTTILTFRSSSLCSVGPGPAERGARRGGPARLACYDSSCTLSDFLILSTEHSPLYKSSPSSPLDTTRSVCLGNRSLTSP